MEHSHASSHPLLLLAAQWRAFAVLLVSLARRTERLRRAGAHEAPRQAEELEIMARAALVPFARQLCALHKVYDDLSPEAEQALKELHVIYVSLMALALLGAKVRSELELKSENCAGRDSCKRISPENLAPETIGGYRRAQSVQRIGSSGYLDSS